MSDIYAPEHQLNAVQQRINFFSHLAFNIPSIHEEIERLIRMEEKLIDLVQTELR